MEINCGCIFLSENFSTKSVEFFEPIKIIEQYDVGELILKGRSKGELAKKGCLIINGEINSVISFLKFNKSILKYLTNIDLTIQFEDDCNFSLSTEQLMFFSGLNQNLNITCFQEQLNT